MTDIGSSGEPKYIDAMFSVSSGATANAPAFCGTQMSILKVSTVVMTDGAAVDL
jgi:hypothetical protein